MGCPGSTKYLFLGDIVDRGEFSLETCLLIYLLKIVYPEDVYIIRGNHEFGSMCNSFGFSREVNKTYGRDSRVLEEFYSSFSYLPLVAMVDQKIICLHGGIGPNMPPIEQISAIKRPIKDFSDPTVSAILWSDPSAFIHGFHSSNRGIGFVFGEDSLISYMDEIKASIMIRGHECVSKGVSSIMQDRVYTVFSASNYCGTSQNQSGVLKIGENQSISPIILPQIPYIEMNCVVFKTAFINESHSFTCNSSPTKKVISSSTSILFPKHKIITKSMCSRLAQIPNFLK